MSGEKQSLLRGSRNLALSTMVCRLLGFFREMLMAAAFGVGAYTSAWAMALTLPSLFRRILGEGALGTALVPMIVHSMEQEGEVRARERFSTILCYLTFLLCLISLVISIPAYIFGMITPPGHWQLAAWLTPFLMPYCVFICAVGVMTCYANSFREYFLPSLAAILQNLVMIGALFLVTFKWYPGKGPADALRLLALSVVLSGVLEFLLLLWIIHKKKMSLILRKSIFKDFETIRSLIKLALPGIFAASSVQLSLVFDRVIAGYLGAYAPSALYFSDRLVYLPIGIFAFAFSTVSLSEMSKAAAKDDIPALADMYTFSLCNLLYVTLPITVFMFLACEELIIAFFKRGQFDAASVNATLYAMLFYIPGIPFFAMNKVTVAAFTARKDMSTPFKVSLVAVALNIILNLLLMRWFKQGGIAFATVLSSMFTNGMLIFLLLRKYPLEIFHFGKLFGMLFKALIFCGVAGVASEWVISVLNGRFFAVQTAMNAVVQCAGGCAVFGLLYLILGIVFRMEEARQFMVSIPVLGRRFKSH